jgi:hypothetical protein
MKAKTQKLIITLVGLLLSPIMKSQNKMAQGLNTMLGDEYNSYGSLYIIGGIVILSLGIYIVFNYLVKEKEVKRNPKFGQFNHLRYHQRHIVKKTS